MTVRLFARGSDGVVAITDGGVDATTHADYLDKPYKNIDNIHFHSGFDYMSLYDKYSVTIEFAAHGTSQTYKEVNKGKDTLTIQVPTVGSNRYELGTHNLGYVPFATATRGGAGGQVTPTLPLQDEGSALRVINIEMDTSKIYVYEKWMTYTVGLTAVTETFDVWVYRNPE